MFERARETTPAADGPIERDAALENLRIVARLRGAFRSVRRVAQEWKQEPWPFGEASNELIADVMHVHVTTVRRWRRDRRVPDALLLLAHILIRGDLSLISPAWKGWELRNGELHCPFYGRPFTVADMEYYSVLTGRAISLEARVKYLEAENKSLRVGAALSDERRADQRAKLKAIGAAEMLQAMSLQLLSTIRQTGSAELRQDEHYARESASAATQLMGQLYIQNDPATGAPFYVNNPASHNGPKPPELRLAATAGDEDENGHDEPPPVSA